MRWLAALVIVTCCHAVAAPDEDNASLVAETEQATAAETAAESGTTNDATQPTAGESFPEDDTLDGSGLKDRKLSEIFEQFVPSETISADNAVPFPVDI